MDYLKGCSGNALSFLFPNRTGGHPALSAASFAIVFDPQRPTAGLFSL